MGGESWSGTPATATGFASLRVYIRPHFRKCSPVATLELRLVSPTASRPHGFPKQALCKVAYARQRARQPSALPGRFAPTRCLLCALVLGLALGYLVRRFAQCSGQWPTANHLVCAPAHPCASPLRGISTARLAHPPPAGAPSSPRRQRVVSAARRVTIKQCVSRSVQGGTLLQMTVLLTVFFKITID